jgi:hypothetical protein
MKPTFRKFAWATVLATALVALVLGAFLLWGLPELLPPGSAIVIDGERFEIGDMTPATAGHWLAASIGVLILAVVIVFVVPLIVVLSIGVPLVLGAFGAALGLLILGLALSPILLLVWWLWKDPKNKDSSTTTIGA